MLLTSPQRWAVSVIPEKSGRDAFVVDISLRDPRRNTTLTDHLCCRLVRSIPFAKVCGLRLYRLTMSAFGYRFHCSSKMA